MTEIQTIGFHKYQFLKSQSALSDAEKEQIQEYEQRMNMNPKPTEEMKAYYRKLNEEKKKTEAKILPAEMYYSFVNGWAITHDKPLVINEDTKINMRVLNRYFARDESFAELCNPISKPSLGKGLLIVGGFGNGKTDFMKTYRAALSFPGYSFKSFTANEVVNMYEDCHEDYDKMVFWKQVLNGKCHFDDVLTERTASNYGKVELFKDIIEGRYDRGSTTYITCNYRNPGDVEDALKQFGEKYGSRVYDRLFEMFNVIDWKGKSFRK